MALFLVNHTSENIATGMREALATWSLDERRLVFITTDNAVSIVKAATLINWTGLQSFGQRLHLAGGKLSSNAHSLLLPLICYYCFI